MGVVWNDKTEDQMSRSWAKKPLSCTFHDDCATGEPTQRYLEQRVQSARLHVAPLPVRLLAMLFGPDLRPTARGLLVARVALALGALLAVVLLAWVLGAVADALVDPTPALPGEGR